MATLELLLVKYGATISLDDAAIELKVCKDTIRNALIRGEIKGRKMGRRWIIPTESIVSYLMNGVPDPNANKQMRPVKGGKLIVI